MKLASLLSSLQYLSPVSVKKIYDYLYPVKKILAISFLFIFPSANTAFGEVLKLPLLIHHYIDHLREGNELSVIDFFVNHYSGKIQHHHQGNNHEHENLPFKSANNNFTNIVSTVPCPVFSQFPASPLKLKKAIPQQQDYSNTYLSNIWQPPRLG